MKRTSRTQTTTNPTTNLTHDIISPTPPTSRPQSLEPPLSSTTNKTPVIGQPSNFPGDPKECQPGAYYAAHGRFASDVVSTIDEKAGLTPAVTSNFTPFVDAPLFGELDLQTPSSTVIITSDLPRREYADELVRTYWDLVDPSEPILDRTRFDLDYEASYSGAGTLLCSDRNVWLSILNVVFALAVQRQEHALLYQRNEEAHRYFLRAWKLLPPEAILWKPGSLEMVQCLMLFNRYLHCTNNQEQTWITAGLAIRMAQNICCHSPEETCNDRQLKEKIWTSCLALDRCVSWSLGKTFGPSMISLPARFTPTFTDNNPCEENKLALKLELHEIGNQIQLAQIQSRYSVAAKFGLPRQGQSADYHTMAVQLDACLTNWELSLPSDWQFKRRREVVDVKSRAERYFLHIRLLIHRIFLYRPMLAIFCSIRSRDAKGQALPASGLSHQVVKEGAGKCVEAAQRISSIVIETLDSDGSFGLLPWWYRICFLHIAGTTFLAAMFGSELYTESVAESWSQTVSALRTHKHLSNYVQQCIQTFEVLSSRIIETRFQESRFGGAAEAETDGFCLDNIFQDEIFEFDNFLFGIDDVMKY